MAAGMKELIMNVDYFDLCYSATMRGDGLYDESKIEQLIAKCAEIGFHTLFWRISACGKVAYRSKVMTVFDHEYRLYANSLGEILQRFDPLQVACQYARRYGLKIYPWVTLFDSYFVGLEDGFFAKHPQYLLKSRDGSQVFRGVPCYAYPEVREYRLAEALELMDYDVDGIMYCAHNSHTGCTMVPGEIEGEDIFGYNQPVVDEYRKRYGVNILIEDFDREKWYNLLGEYLTCYLQEVWKELHERNKELLVTIKRGEYAIGGVYPKAKIHIDWRTWVKQDIVDGLIFPTAYGVDNIVPGEDIDSLEKYKSLVAGKCRICVWYTVWTPHATKSEIERIVRRVQTSNLDGITFHEADTFEFVDGCTGRSARSIDLWSLIYELQQG